MKAVLIVTISLPLMGFRISLKVSGLTVNDVLVSILAVPKYVLNTNVEDVAPVGGFFTLLTK